MSKKIAIASLFGSLFLTAVLQNEAVAEIAATIDTGTVSVAAKLNYLQEQNFFRNLQLQLIRNQQPLSSSNLPVQQLPDYSRRYGYRASKMDAIILDLDSNGEPEIIVDVAEAKANCCSSSFIYTYNPQSNRYLTKVQYWGQFNSGYWQAMITGQKDDRRLADFDNDGFYEFAATDYRFRTRFGSGGKSFAPVQIWRYQEGNLKNVTKEYPYLIFLSAESSWEAYQQILSESGAEAAKSAMAAYVGAKYLLGEGAEATQQLQQAYGSNSSGQRFISLLTTFLRQAGYR
jgi:hypothetical protein